MSSPSALHLRIPITHNQVRVPVDCEVTVILDEATVLGMKVPEHIRTYIYTALEEYLLEQFMRTEEE